MEGRKNGRKEGRTEGGFGFFSPFSLGWQEKTIQVAHQVKQWQEKTKDTPQQNRHHINH